MHLHLHGMGGMHLRFGGRHSTELGNLVFDYYLLGRHSWSQNYARANQ